MRSILLLGAIVLAGCAGHQPLVHVRPLSYGAAACKPGDGASRLRCGMSGAALALGQCWTKRPVPLEATRVRFAWRPDALVVFAEMDDRRIGNLAPRDNEKTWEMGDAFEVFLEAPGARDYVEIHVTPENRRLHLRYPSAGPRAIARGRTDISEYFLKANESRRITSSVIQGKSRWSVALVIPADLVAGGPIRAGTSWRFSVARYDGDRAGTPPVLSASSRYRKLDFHRRSEWGTLKFTKG